MPFVLNRELKAYCAYFAPIRVILRARGVVFVEVKEQVDYYYHLPVGEVSEGTRRLKPRIEKGTGSLIYYCDRQEAGARISWFQLSPADDPAIGEVLDRPQHQGRRPQAA